MQSIHFSEVIVPEDRQRTDISSDHLNDLATDFAEIGILQPIVLRNDGKTLVVGECRLRAVKIFYASGKALTHNGESLPQGHIPYNKLSDLTPAQVFQAELHENKFRKNLSVIDEARAIARYHELRKAENKDQTAVASARELIQDFPEQRSATKVIRDAEIIAKHSHLPEVAKAKTQNEALRAIKREVGKGLNAQLSAAIIDTYTGEHEQLLGDAREAILTIADQSFDCICTDPPYGVGADSFGTQQEQGHVYKDDFEYFSDLMQSLAPEFYRVAAEQCHLYLFCDIRHFEFLNEVFTQAGWDVWQRPLIWHKAVGSAVNLGILPRPEHGPRNTYDAILFANKGDKKVNAVHPDVISNYPRTTVSGHAAEKPANLYAHLLGRSVQPGDRVFDAFAGGGPIYPAANSLHCQATGINLNKDDYNLAATRYNEQLL
jgi:DNA modification methylase